jgi:ABC-type multidrug transport system fused ATPase/permease subunit
MTLVNTICFILAIVTPYLDDCSIYENVPSVRILTTLKLIVPLALVGSHSSFVEVWKRKILAAEKVVRYSDLLSLKIHYLNNLNADGSTNSIINVHNHHRYLALVVIYIVALTAFWLAIVANQLKNGSGPWAICTFDQFTLFLFYIPLFIVCANSGVVTFLFVVVLGRTATISYKLMSSWMDRYLHFQRLRIVDLKKYLNKDSPYADVSDKAFAGVLRRDAFERYLLVSHFMKETSASWDLPIGLLMAVCMLLTVFGSIFAILSFGNISAIILCLIFPISGLLIPAFCIAYANTAMDQLRQILMHSVPMRDASYNEAADDEGNPLLNRNPEQARQIVLYSVYDFEAIGGREEWLKYMDENPIYW